MTVRRFSPDGVAAPTGLYSHVSITESGVRLAWFAGQVGRLADGGMPRSAGEQTEVIFDNLAVLFDKSGLGPDDLVQMHTYLVGRESLSGFAQARNARFSIWFGDGPSPPNTLVIVQGLADPRALVEVEAVGVVPNTA
jgi:2-iminobutanoate/2-iminopropanoate deaminase